MVLDRNVERQQLLRNLVLQAVDSGSSKSAQELISEIHNQNQSFSAQEIEAAIKELERDEKLLCTQPSKSYWNFLAQSHLEPTLLLRSLGVALGLFVLALPQAAPWSIVRMVAACILLLFSPGNALIESIFPRKHLDTPERVALSVGISVVLVAFTTLAASFQFGHFNIDAVVIALAAFTIGLTMASRYLLFRRNARK